MNSYNTFIFFAFILLFSSSSLAYRIYPNQYENISRKHSTNKMMMDVPNEGDHLWSQYVLPSMNPVPDGK